MLLFCNICRTDATAIFVTDVTALRLPSIWRMTMIIKKCWPKRKKNMRNSNSMMVMIIMPYQALFVSQRNQSRCIELYNHKGDCLVPKMPIVDVNKDDKQLRCNIQLCKVTQPILMLPCYCFNKRDHPKYAHTCCFKEHILEKHHVQHPNPEQHENFRVGVCTKNCYLKYKVSFKKEPQSKKVVW